MLNRSKLIISIMLMCAVLFAQTPGVYFTSRVDEAPQIDGLLNDACWQTANYAGDFKMHQPHDDRPASFQTEFAIYYDNNSIYVGVRAFDPEPEKINRNLNRRDNVNSEFVAICFDSYNDNTTCYCFFISAAGVVGDLFISKDGENNDESWNAIFWAKSNIDSLGWTAEFRIPLSQLRFVDKEEHVWGLELMRNVHRLDEESFWMEHKRSTSGFVHDFGELRGLNNIKPRKVFDLMPYAVTKLETYEAETGNPYRDGSDLNFNGGLDGKIGLSNNFTMDFTINPDFGQVEADPATVNLSAFETFFSERRPFFIEGSNITAFPLDVNGGREQIFYSRRVGRRPHHWPNLNNNEYAKVPNATDILAAAKITGRTEKGLNIGIVEAVTQRERALISTPEGDTLETVEPMSNFTVAAVRQDLKDGDMQIGGIVTSMNRDLSEEHLNYLHKNAYTGAFDMRYYGKDHVWQIDVRALGSYVNGSTEAISRTQKSSSHLYQRPDASWVSYDSTRTSLAGHGGSVRLGKFGGDFRAAFKFKWKSPGLELNDIGFVGQTDEIAQNIWLNYRKTEPFSIFNRASVSMVQWNNFNFGGIHQNSGLTIEGDVQFKNRYNMHVGIEWNSPFTSSTVLRGGPRLTSPGSYYTWMWAGTDYTKDLHAWGLVVAGVDPEGHHHGLRYEGELEWKINSSINVFLFGEWARQHNGMQYVTTADFYGEKAYILSRFHQETLSLQLGLNMNITPDISLEYRGRPYFTSGRYDEFKRVTDGTNPNYDDRFDLFTHNIAKSDGLYYCDQDRDSRYDYTFWDPNFVYTSFQSNFVFRWEYMPGSTLYLVWSMNKELSRDGNFIVLPNDYYNLRNEIPQNAFLMKVSYRLGR